MTMRWFSGMVLVGLMVIAGCSRTARDLKLDANVARAALEKAMQAWVDGKKPADLKPEITVGDSVWNSGKTLVSFEIKTTEEKSDGTNLYIPVVRQLKDDKGRITKSEMLYVVGTSPVITIFPQET